MAELLTTKQAAEILGVHPVTMRKWRVNSDLVVVNGKAALEDCQGLLHFFENERKVLYWSDSVQRLKRILERRKTK